MYRAYPLSLLLCTALSLAVRADEGIDFFEKKIHPVLVNRCYECHSATAKKLRGGLHLDSRGGVSRGGDSGPAIVPGEPDKSLLIKAIRQTDPALKMPPKGKLSAQEIADFEEGVRRSAPDPREAKAATPAGTLSPQQRWAFSKPQEPKLPDVKRTDWVQSPIDRFILAKLEAKGLQQSPPADKRTLLRRVTYDLTGLPPTAEEVDAFLADSSPNAFAKVVDRLLASPHYGERWGRHWLDLVRYTDDFDLAWRYRDWVVRAFNEDMPYDQFVLYQIAGDRVPTPSPLAPLPLSTGGEGGTLLPSPPLRGRGAGCEGAGGVNPDGIVATTMLSIGQWGGIDRKKRMADIVDDQIDTIGRTFLGLTLACARCHDHKFDPLTTKDYYALAGIFYSSRVISDMVYLSHGTERLRIPLVPPADVEKHAQHMARVRALEKRLHDEVEKHYEAFARSLLPRTGEYIRAAWDYQHRPGDQSGVSVQDFAAKRKLHAFAVQQWINYLGGHRLSDIRLLHVSVKDYDGERGVHVWGAHAERPWWGVNSNQHEVAIETWLLPPRTVSMNPGIDGGAAVWKSPITGRVRITGKLVDGDPHDGVGISWAIDRVSGGVRHELSSGTLPNGGTLTLEAGRHRERLAAIDVKPDDELWLQMWLTSSDAHYDITNVEFKVTCVDGSAEWDLTRDVVDNLLDGNPHRDSLSHADVWSFYDLAGSGRKGRMPAVDRALATLEPLAGEKRGDALQAMIDLAGTDSPLVHDLIGIRSPFWVRERDDAKYLPAEAQKALAQRAGELQALKQSAPPFPCAHGVQEGGPRFSIFPGVQDARIHVRGTYERLGDTVPRRIPIVLAGDKQPPITSGSGRLELARWIGSGDNPMTARVMVNRVWQHHFGEGIVRTPSNFGRMGTPATHPELLDWLACRFVSDGWSVKKLHREILLSSAYQQSSRPSVEALRADPDNLLFSRMNRQRLEAEELRDSLLAVCGRLDPRRAGPAEDKQSRRRMVYMAAKRADRSGFRTLFDGADASIHVEKRSSSTVAPQALYLMNGPLVLDAVKHLVQRATVAGDKPADRVQALYRLVLARDATAEELSVGCQFIESQQTTAGTGQPADPWEAYAQALLLSNEFLFVD
jgi:hypothetical protein